MNTKYLVLIIGIVVIVAIGGYYAYNSSIDKAPPTIKSGDPSINATNVPVDKVIKITFNEPIEKGSLFNQITVKQVNGSAQQISKSINGSVLTIKLSNGTYTNGATYSIIIPAKSITDLKGNEIQTKTYKFTVVS